jgi:hypothetical protein
MMGYREPERVEVDRVGETGLSDSGLMDREVRGEDWLDDEDEGLEVDFDKKAENSVGLGGGGNVIR